MRRPRLHGAPGAAEPAALGLLRGPGRARGSRPRRVGSGRGRGWGGRAAARNGVRTAGTVVAAAGGARARAGNRQGSGVSRSRCGDRCQGNRLRLFAGLAAPPPRRSHNPPPHSGFAQARPRRAQPSASETDPRTPPHCADQKTGYGGRAAAGALRRGLALPRLRRAQAGGGPCHALQLSRPQFPLLAAERRADLDVRPRGCP